MRPSTDCPPHRPADLTPSALVDAACRGDERAWAEIVRRYGRLVTCVVGSYRLQEADVADAEAGTWLRAVEKLPTLRDPDRLGGRLRTWAKDAPAAVQAAEVDTTGGWPEPNPAGVDLERGGG